MSHILEIEDLLGKTIPTSALTEISHMSSYYEIPRLSITVKQADAIFTNTKLSKDIINTMIGNDNEVYLKLSYDMHIFRKKGIRKAVCSNFLYIRKSESEYIKIILRMEMELEAKNNKFDQMMFSACYLYAKNLLESIKLNKYTKSKVEFPENYASIDIASKEFYDGYIEYRNQNLVRLDVNAEELREK